MNDWGDIGTCDQCGEDGIEVILSEDPYITEIYNEHTNKEYWCERCYDSRYGDV